MVFDKTRKYYVYTWRIAGTDEVIYVGKGTGNRYKIKKRENSYFMKMIETHDCVPEIIIDGLTEEEAFDYEKMMIAVYRASNYRLTNVQDGGEQPPNALGIKRSEETKALMSKAMRAYFESHPEASKIRSERLKRLLNSEEGKTFRERSNAAKNTDEFRAAQSEKCRAANSTPEYIERQSALVKKMWESEDYRAAHCGAGNGRAHGVQQYDLDGNLIREYKTLFEAEKATGANFSKISAVCNGKRKTAGGFVWKYVDGPRPMKSHSYKYDAAKDMSARPIIQCDLQGNEVAEYISIADASRSNPGMGRTNIIHALKGKTKTAYGYVWKYK